MSIKKYMVCFATAVSLFLLFSSTLLAQEPGESFPPLPEALLALESDSIVTVQEQTVEEWEEGLNFYYTFEPQGTEPTVGFIIYPGGLVDAASYAPIARDLAAKGFLTVLVKMPGDLAIKDAERATAVIDDYEKIESWVIGGHSLGDVASCAYAKNNSEKVFGVVMLASYPSEIFRIDDKDLRVISIYGTNDGLATVAEDIEPSKEHFPPDAQFEPIVGGNHTHFGWYNTSPGPLQPGDKPADITREDQQEQTVQLIAGFLDQFVESTVPCLTVTLYGEDSDEVQLLRHFQDTILIRTT